MSVQMVDDRWGVEPLCFGETGHAIRGVADGRMGFIWPSGHHGRSGTFQKAYVYPYT